MIRCGSILEIEEVAEKISASNKEEMSREGARKSELTW